MKRTIQLVAVLLGLFISLIPLLLGCVLGIIVMILYPFIRVLGRIGGDETMANWFVMQFVPESVIQLWDILWGDI